MQKTMPFRRRARVAAGSLGLGLVVLVGCAGTIDGRASVGRELGSIGTTTSSSTTAESSGSSDTSDPVSTDATTTDSSSTETSTTAGTSSGDVTSSGGSTTSDTSTSSGSSPSSSGSATAGTTTTGDPDGLGLTAPGAQLTYGAPAMLPFAYADAEGVFTVSGLSVTRGSEADWATLGVDTADAQGEEPWYIRVSLKQESGGDFSYTSVQDDFWAYTADGDVISTVYPDDDTNALCPVTYAPEGFTVGQSYDACVVLSVNLGESVERVQFEGGYDADDPYYESPVVWTG